MTPVLVFDIETVPDVAGIRRIHAIGDKVDDAGVLAWFSQRRRATAGTDFAPIHLQKVVAIGCALRDAAGLRIWSVGDPGDPEPELIRRFFDGIEKYSPQLVSWNGSGFDLPVLNHRALIHGICASRYWDWGDDDREFRFNNYLARFHTRHLDVMDVVAQYQPRAAASLDAMARLCGFPGKLGMDGADVANAIAAGRIDDVRSYCECDVLNTYLLYQRFRLMRGEVDAGEYARELSLVRERIAGADAPHWRTFVAKWTGAAGSAPTA
ncbi:MAG TPA: 3'-5' exonuclease [Casimicrobiaceae bacterium]|nr:3'-5' exonuclease [Casimicrobiaceae bacterium]